MKEAEEKPEEDQNSIKGEIVTSLIANTDSSVEGLSLDGPPMVAYGIETFGAPVVIVQRVLARPRPNKGQIVVKIAAAGVGPWDGWIRAGKSTRVSGQDLPVTLGSEVSGVVVEVGADVTSPAVGDEVYGTPNLNFTGGYAEYALMQRDMVARKPRLITHDEAASMPVVACTAWTMLFELAKVKSQQRVLVLGGSGSVGAYAVQLATSRGAVVVATGSASEESRLKWLGAHQVIDSRVQGGGNMGGPFDVVIDTVGGDLQLRAMRTLVTGGILVSAVSEPDQLIAHELGIRGLFFIVKVSSACLEELAKMVDAGQLMTKVGTTLPLNEARRAHELMESTAGPRPGKIVLSMSR